MADAVNDPTYVPFPFYKMNACPRGICLIINNRNFNSPHGRRPLPTRTGSDVDKAALAATFEKLQLIVECHEDLTDVEMVLLLKRVSLLDHSLFDCFVCCILSHGRHRQVYGSNGVEVDIACLADQVKAQGCPSLNGKPKLFFIQACLGPGTQRGIPSLETDSVPELNLIPNEGDFLFGFSTVPGFESYRDPELGSLYVRKLVYYLDKYAEKAEIHDILTKVNKAVGEEMNYVLNDDGTESLYKQTPAPQYTLRKKLIFFPLSSSPAPDTGVNIRRRGDPPAHLMRSDRAGPSSSDASPGGDPPPSRCGQGGSLQVPLTGKGESTGQRESSSATGQGEVRNAPWRRSDSGPPDPGPPDPGTNNNGCRRPLQKPWASTKW